MKTNVLWFSPSELPLTYKQCQRTLQDQCFWITPPPACPSPATDHAVPYQSPYVSSKPKHFLLAHYRRASRSDSGSILIKALSSMQASTLFLFRSTKIWRVPLIQQVADSTLLSHWACFVISLGNLEYSLCAK